MTLVLAGCKTTCGGPACEDSFPAAKLAVHRGADPWSAGTEADVWTGAWATVTGARDDGSDWSAAVGLVDGVRAAGVVTIGMPEAGVVASVTVAAGDQDTSAAARVIGPTGFGARLVPGNDEVWIGSPALFSGLGRAAGFVAAAPTIDGTTAGDRLGDALADCGDLTGDGASEVLVGIPGWSGADALPGAARLAGAVVLVRSDAAGGLPWEAGPVWWGVEQGAGLGRAVACGDVDDDGIADLIAGAPFGGTDDRGQIYLVSGAALAGTAPDDATWGAGAGNTISTVAARSYVGSVPFGWAGSAFAVLDLTDTAANELAVGAPGGGGAVLLYDPLRADTVPIATITGAGHFGKALAAADVTGDDRADLLAAAPDLDVGRSHDVGRLDVLEPRTAFPRVADVTELATGGIAGSRPFQRVGGAIGLADVDGDGIFDVLLPTRAPRPE